MLDAIRRRVVAGISLCLPFSLCDRARPAFALRSAFNLRATFAWLESGKAGRGAVILFGRGITAALLVTVTGCAVGPDFAPPSAPVASNWLEWRNKSLQTGPEEYRDWWRVFHDPILDRLIDIAYSQNLTLLSAGTKVLQARAALGIAIGEFYPQQQLAAGATTYNLRSISDASGFRWLDRVRQLLAESSRCAGGMGAGLLGQVPPWRRIRRFRLSGFDRDL